jgi:MFS family permease
VQSYGIFLAYYLTNNAFPGATPLHYAFVGGLSIAMSQTVSPISTILMRNYGIKAPLWLGIFLQTAALLGASWSTEIWQLFLSQGVCFGWGMGFTFNATVGIIPQWFERRRSFANSIGAAGSGIGGLIWSLATNAMIQNLGTGWAFRILAIVSAVVCGACALLLRDRNKEVGAVLLAFDTSLLKRPEFVLTLAWGTFSMLGYVSLLFSLPNYATSIGLSQAQGSIVGAMLNLGQFIGRPCIGYFSDSVGRLNMCVLCTFACGIFCFALWIPATSYALLIVFAILGGGVAGTIWTTVAPVCAEIVGLQILPSALSIFWVSLILPSTFAEVIAMQLKKQEGAVYRNAQIFTGLMFVCAGLCLWWVRAWKIVEMERAGDLRDPVRREKDIRDDDEVPKSKDEGEAMRRTVTLAESIKSKAKLTRGLWLWIKV